MVLRKKMLFWLVVLAAWGVENQAEAASAGCVCIQLYQPVCGKDGKTYSNSCMASCAKVAVQCRGPCPCKKAPSRSRPAPNKKRARPFPKKKKKTRPTPSEKKKKTCKQLKCRYPRICHEGKRGARCICNPVRCKIFCPFGFKKIDGCPSCSCLPPPFRQKKKPLDCRQGPPPNRCCKESTPRCRACQRQFRQRLKRWQKKCDKASRHKPAPSPQAPSR